MYIQFYTATGEKLGQPFIGRIIDVRQGRKQLPDGRMLRLVDVVPKNSTQRCQTGYVLEALLPE